MTSNLQLIQARVKHIPKGWELTTVKSALSIRNNLRKPISQEVRSTIQGDYPYYGPTKIQDYISQYEQDGTFALIGEDGDHFLKYDKMSQTQLVSGKCTVNNHAHLIESTNKCDAEWFYVYFRHRDITNFLTRQGAGRFKLNKATLEKLLMLLPPLPEQKKIAQILTTWDEAITTTEQLIEASKVQHLALLQQLYDNAFQNHDSSPVKLSEIMSESRIIGSNGKNAKKITIKLYGKGVVPKDEKRAGSESTTYYKRKAGQFIYSKLDFLNGAFGLIPQELDGYESTLDLPAFDLTDKVNPIWLINLVSRKSFYKSQLGLANGGRKARRVNPKDFLKIRIALPSTDKQNKIAKIITCFDSNISFLEEKLTTLRKEKKALMQQLLTGKRLVKVDDEVQVTATAC